MTDSLSLTNSGKGSRLVALLSLTRFDRLWHETVASSAAGKLWSSLSGFAERLGSEKLEKLGTCLQSAGFLLVLALTAAIGLKQFANDKEGLAIFVLAGLGLRIAGRLFGGKERYPGNAVDAAVLAFLGANVVAACASHYCLESLKGLAKLLIFVASYFLFADAAGQSRRRIITLVSMLVATGFFVSLYGLYQYKIGVAPLATWEDPTMDIKGTRIYSTLGNPNLLAGYLIPLLPLSFSLSMVATWTRRYWLTIPLLAVAAVIGLAIILTGSRGAYIGLVGVAISMAAIIGSWLWKERPRTRFFLVLALLAVPVLLFAALHFLPTVEARVMSIFAGGEHTSNRYRMNVWLASLRMFQDSWWFGVGPGNKAFELAYGLYMMTGFDALGTYCVPLEVAVESGLLGLATFAGLLVAALARAHFNFYSSEDGCLRWLLAGCTSGLIGLMTHGLVDTVFYRPQVQFVFWMIVAIIVSSGAVAKHKNSS
jgi:putative inorganic carbon (HCO3(-)) transporter